MNDDFNKKLWELASTSTSLQEAIKGNMSGGYYSIPTGDITVSIFEHKDEPQQEKMVEVLKMARELTVADLARILAEVRIALIFEEVKGEALKPHEKTLRDIDVTALATFALAKWVATKRED